MAQRRQKGGTSIAVVAEWRHKHCRGCRMEAQWSPIGRQVIDAFCCKFPRQSERCFCLPCRWSSYTETGFSGVRRPLSVLAIFWSFKGGTKVAILYKGGKKWGKNRHSLTHSQGKNCKLQKKKKKKTIIGRKKHIQ